MNPKDEEEMNINHFKQRMYSDKEFDELLDIELEHLKKYIKKHKPTDYMAELRVVLKKGFDEEPEIAVVAFGDMPAPGEQRQRMMFGVGAKFAEEHAEHGQPVAVIFTSEGWARQLKEGKETEDFYKAGKNISEYEDKKEVLATYGQTMDGRRCMAMQDIKRNAKGEMTGTKLTLFAPTTDTETPKFGSNIIENFYKGYAAAYMGSHIKKKGIK